MEKKIIVILDNEVIDITDYQEPYPLLGINQYIMIVENELIENGIIKIGSKIVN